jgi:hypothetical protein
MTQILNTLYLVSILAMMQDDMTVFGRKVSSSLVPDVLNEADAKPASVPDLNIPSINEWINKNGEESFLENDKHRAFMCPPYILVLQSESKDRCTNYFAGLQKHEMLVSQLLMRLRFLLERDHCNEGALYDFTQSYTDPEIVVDKGKNFVSIKCTFKLRGTPLNQRSIKVGQYRNTISNDETELFSDPDDKHAQRVVCSSLLYSFITIQNELAGQAQRDFPSINIKSLLLPMIDYDALRHTRSDFTGLIVGLVLGGILCIITVPALIWFCIWRVCFAHIRGRPGRTVIVTRDPPGTSQPGLVT